MLRHIKDFENKQIDFFKTNKNDSNNLKQIQINSILTSKTNDNSKHQRLPIILASVLVKKCHIDNLVCACNINYINTVILKDATHFPSNNAAKVVRLGNLDLKNERKYCFELSDELLTDPNRQSVKI